MNGMPNSKFVSLKLLSLAASVLAVLVLVGSGCSTPTPEFSNVVAEKNPPKPGEKSPPKPEALVLHEGDTLRFTFPGAPTLNAVQQIRRDGRVALPLVGELQAAGLTTAELEKELIKAFGPQLQTKEVTVTLESSAYAVYVTGAVLRPGKIMSDRPLTALEAIMEAGGFDYTKANLKAVKVIRKEDGRTRNFTLNLKNVLDGKESEQFTLKPSDIIYVQERFKWF